MATFSANGKRLGRPPGSGKTKVALAVVGRTDNPRIRQSDDAQALAIGRATMHFMARYDAAGRGRRVAAWNPPSSGPNSSMEGLQTIRDRSRDTVRNDWAGTSAVQKWSTTLVGIGITPRFNRIKRKERKQEIVDLFSDFVAKADADAVLNLYGLQTMVTRAWLADGECFVRRRSRYLDDGLPVPVQLQVLEADMLPIFSADSMQGLPSNHVIKDGIEFDRRMQRIAYWFYREHPGDDAIGRSVGPDMLVRVLARDVCHVYEPARPGARRGVSMLAPIIMRLRNSTDYEDTTLERQKIANLWVGFITRELPRDAGGTDLDAITGLERVVDSEGNGLVPLRPGLIQELEDGQKFDFANPPEAGTTYSDYLRTNHLGTSAGTGLPYEVFSGDIRQISDRTLRVIINEYRRFAEQRQWQILIPQFCQRAIEWFAEAAVVQGAISPEEFDDVRRVEHQPHGWAYIHPVQDPQGKLLEIEGGIRSRSSAIGEKGDDPDLVDQERADDDAREKRLKIGPYSEAAVQERQPATTGDEDGIDNEEYTAPPNARIRRAIARYGSREA
ncbi:MAG: phage portal protein [Pseudoxanthomonas sp.]|nr:MAG: phage portal protein [Pseudoxanthomonas sp.]